MTPTSTGAEVSAAPLGKPLHFEFSGRDAPNRFLKAAMTERLSSWDPTNTAARGVPSAGLINVYKRWGEGGFGHILTGNIMVHPEHLEARGNPIIPEDAPFSGERFEAFKKMGAESKAHGSLVVGQLSHPGRQTAEAVQPHPISASDVQLEGNLMGMTFAKPRPMTKEDIKKVINEFAHAAEYLYKAGYDGVQLHAAHGYLLAQYLSPTTNLRTDEYGGSLENRSRLILEIAKEIRKRVPQSFILGIKINSVEFQDKGFSTEECKQICTWLEQHQFDFVELSGGTYQELAFTHKRESTKKREAFFLEFAEVIIPALTKTKVYVTGGLRSVGAMVNALKTVDGVGIARPTCQEFDLPNKILSGKVQGAVQQKLDEDDFAISNVAAGSLIRMVSKDQQPLDLSKEEGVESLKKSIGAWRETMSNDQGGYAYGFVDFVDIEPKPYGEAY
ncbi:MAG: hypothetical protein LQ340_000657 [Diploschistes diacapsis]|nr:MAG: hypothetical protein LQ340_000657 [Diploschistes diacapsis]